jgi:hypothetical protein
MSEEVSGKPARIAPNVQESAARLRQEIEEHYTTSGLPIPPALADMVTLAHILASILAPLYADVHATFTNPPSAAVHHPPASPNEV